MFEGIMWERWPYLASAGLLFALAAWLTRLDFSSRLHRSFALFLFVLGTRQALFAFLDSYTGLARRLFGYFELALPFAVAYFAYVYLNRYGVRGDGTRPPHRPWIPALLLVGCAACLGWYAFDKKALTQSPSFLLAVTNLYVPAMALIAVVLLRQARNARGEHHHESLVLLSLGFLLPSSFHAFHSLFILASPGTLPLWSRDPTSAISIAMVAAAAPLLTYAVVRGARAGGGVPLPAYWRVGGGFALASLTAAAGGLLYLIGSCHELPGQPVCDASAGLVRFFVPVWTLALPLLAFFGVVRYRLFDVDVRARWVVSRGSVAFLILGVFIIVGQLAQNFTAERFSWWVGAIVAGLLLLALAPLQGIAERVAKNAVPRGRPIQDLTPTERTEFYREQVRLAWLDGTLTLKERRMLDAMRDRLAIDRAEAAQWEEETLATLSPRRRGKRSDSVPTA